MTKAISFLAGLGVGSYDEKRRLEREAKDKAREDRQNRREDVADARATEVYNAGKAERDLAVSDRTELRTAAAPVPVTPEAAMPETMDARDIGAPGEAPVPVTGYTVRASRFATQGLAQDAAVQQANQRVAQVMDIHDPAGRQKRQTEALQGKLATLQLKEAAKKAMNEGVLEALQAAAGGASPEQVAAIYNRNGEKKVAGLKVEPFEFDHPVLGKQRSARISGTFEDGTPLQVKDAFTSSLDLFGAAEKFHLLGHWGETARKAKHDDGMLGIAKQNADSLEAQRKGTESYQMAHLGLERARLDAANKPPTATADSTFDRKLYEKIAEEQANKEAAAARDAGKPMTQAQVVRAASGILNTAYADHVQQFNTSQIQRQLSAARASPQVYAAMYADAAKAIPPAQLAAMGFMAPGARDPRAPIVSPAGKAMQAAEKIPGSVTLGPDGRYVAVQEPGAPAAPSRSAMEVVDVPPSYLNEEGKRQWIADKPKRMAEEAAKRRLRIEAAIRAGQNVEVQQPGID